MNEIHLGNRTVGKINAKGAFETHRREDLHLFLNFQGLGFNKKLMEKLPLQKEIWVFYLKKDGETILLKTTASHILLKGIQWENYKDIKDNQLILPLDEFEKN